MKEKIISLLSKQIKIPKQQIENLIEIPPNPRFGDYAFPCFVLSKKFKKNPNEIAKNLKQKLDKNLPREIDEIIVVGPYLNFFINKKIFAKNTIKEILKQKNKYGKLNIGKRKKALIEHTSINPNASPHVGRARNAILGDSITRILSFIGYNPETHYYVNDVSKQIAMLVLAEAENLPFEKMLKTYSKISKEVEKNPSKEKQVFELLNKFEKKDKETRQKFKKIVDTCINGQEKILENLGIKYDSFDYESKYLGKTKKILKKLEKTGRLFKDKHGRHILNQENTKLEKMMKSPVWVLTRGDRTGLYPLRDIAYTIDKLKIAKKNIIILGEDHKLYFLQLKQALNLLGFKSPEAIHYAFVLIQDSNLKKDKNNISKNKKMSTRKGNVILLEDFLKKAIHKASIEIKKRHTKGDPKKVAIAAVKYSILKNNANKQIIFNLNEALSFEGDTGPYLLYGYARASSIIKKSKKHITNKLKISLLKPNEIKLIKKLAKFPEIVENASQKYDPSLIANYSFQLVQIFNEFYHSCPVIGDKNENFRLVLVQSFKHVLKNSLNLLGIETLEEM